MGNGIISYAQFPKAFIYQESLIADRFFLKEFLLSFGPHTNPDRVTPMIGQANRTCFGL